MDQIVNLAMFTMDRTVTQSYSVRLWWSAAVLVLACRGGGSTGGRFQTDSWRPATDNSWAFTTCTTATPARIGAKRPTTSALVSADPSDSTSNVSDRHVLFTDILRSAKTFPVLHTRTGRLGSRVVGVLDSGAEGPGFNSQPRRCRVTVLGQLFTPIVPLFTKQQN